MLNQDAAEIAKFDELAATWWDSEGPSRPLHQINPLRLQFISQHAELQHKTVVDIGCGGGILTESMAKLGAKALGIDAAPALIQVAKLHALEADVAVNYQCKDVAVLAQEQPASFDVITCMEMLEHVPEPQMIFAAAASLVKSGGKLFFSTLNRNWRAYFKAIIGAEYFLKLLPTGTHDYEKFITPAECCAYARAAGLRVKAMTGMGYWPILKKYYLSDDVSVNYLLYCEKP